MKDPSSHWVALKVSAALWAGSGNPLDRRQPETPHVGMKSWHLFPISHFSFVIFHSSFVIPRSSAKSILPR
jgi:hypothetical protein